MEQDSSRTGTLTRERSVNEIPQETLEQRVVRLSHVAPAFERAANQLVLSLRRAMGVPDQAEPEVEQEFATLRSTLDEQFRPEFDKMYASLCMHFLGPASSVVLNSLEDSAAQAYLAASERIAGDVGAALRAVMAELDALLSPPLQH